MENRDLHKFQQELIEDISFIHWVQSDFEIDNEKWSVFIDENIDFMEDINQAIKFVRNLDFNDDNVLDIDNLWKKIEKSTNQHSKYVKRTIPLAWKYIVAIAVISIGTLLILMPFTSDKKLQTFKAIAAHLTTEAFPDGSAVTINPGSEVTFNPREWDKNRKVSLKGLAFFKVRKGVPFTVETEKGTITVLGTSFSVDARNGRFEVICKTGKVRVQSSYGEDKILEAGSIATLVSGSLLTQKRPEGAIGLVSWMDGNFTFQDVDFGEVIAEIENQFDVRVQIDSDLTKLKYTGFFNNHHLNDALFSITWPLKLKYSVKDKEVHIVKE